MNRGFGTLTQMVVIATAVVAGPIGVHASEEELLYIAASGMYDAQEENLLEITGLTGDVSVRIGKGSELRFLALALPEKDREIDIELWRIGSVLRVMPSEAGMNEAVDLEISVPAQFDVMFDLRASSVQARSLRGSLEIKGSGLDAEVGSLKGSLSAEIENGSIRIVGVEGSASLELTDVEGSVTGIGRDLDGTFVRGRLDLRSINGEADLNYDGTDLSVRDVGAKLRLEGEEGSAKVYDLKRGGEFRLTESPLELSRCKGDLDVETDALVRFADNEATMHINSWGGPVKGVGLNGVIEIKTDSAEVDVGTVEGPVRVSGNRLNVRLEKIQGNLEVYTTSSDVVIEDAASTVLAECEATDLKVMNASKKVAVSSLDGDVSIVGSEGEVDVLAESDEVLVSWSAMNTTSDSRIRNNRGNVTVRFPSQGGCSVEARTGLGKINSEIDTVAVGDDEKQASGDVNGRSRPTLTIEAQGDITLVAPEPETE